jgi:hypothetical protein
MTAIAAMKSSNIIQHHLFSQSPSRLVLIPGSAGSFLIVWLWWFFIPFVLPLLFLREQIRQFLHHRVSPKWVCCVGVPPCLLFHAEAVCFFLLGLNCMALFNSGHIVEFAILSLRLK